MAAAALDVRGTGLDQWGLCGMCCRDKVGEAGSTMGIAQDYMELVSRVLVGRCNGSILLLYQAAIVFVATLACQSAHHTSWAGLAMTTGQSLLSRALPVSR